MVLSREFEPISETELDELEALAREGDDEAAALLEELAEHLSSQIDVETAPDWFHEGQRAAWEVTERIALLLWGNQSGKTIYGPHWLLREIQRTAESGADNAYLLAGPTIELLKKKALPTLATALKGLAEFSTTDRSFRFTPEGVKRLTGYTEGSITIFVGYATKSDSLESATYKAAWLDEAGQDDFKGDSWEAIRRRLAIHQGRVLITTTPYNFGWLKRTIYDRRHEDHICVVPFESKDNPAYPIEEWEEAERTLAPWKFDLFYRGLFTRPVGVVYDCYDKANEVEFGDFFPDGEIPEEWPIWVGADFGAVHTAFVLIAEKMELDMFGDWEPMDEPEYCVFKTYQSDGRKTAVQHLAGAFRGMGEEREIEDGMFVYRLKRDQVKAFGGALGEKDTRELYYRAGLNIAEPTITGSNSIDPQIDCVYAALSAKRLKVCKHLTGLIKDFEEFSYELDKETTEVTQKYKDEHKYHRLAGLRYVVPSFFRTERKPRKSGSAYSIGQGVEA